MTYATHLSAPGDCTTSSTTTTTATAASSRRHSTNIMAFPPTRMTPGLRLTPRQSPHYKSPVTRSPVKSPMREEQCLSLKQVIGTTADSGNGFDYLESRRSFAFVAGAAAVLAHVDDDLRITQRFFRAKPTAGPFNSNTPIYDSPTPAPTTSFSTRSRLGSSTRESGVGLPPFDLSASTSSAADQRGGVRERTKAATCVSLSRDGKLLAIGESGHRPRVLVFSTSPEAPADIPLVAVAEHTYGVRCVAFSPDSQYLASLGEVNDGFLYIWRINRTTGSATIQASNKCTSYVRQMAWVGNTLVTVGQRHVKVWRLNDEQPKTSPSKRLSDAGLAFSSPSRTLQGRNCLLGSLLDKTFTCVLPLSPSKAIVCSDDGHVCLLDDLESSPRFQRITDCRFRVNSAVRLGTASVVLGGLEGEMKTLNIDAILQSARTRTPTAEPAEERSLRPLDSAAHVLAMVPLGADSVLTLDSTHHMQILRLHLDQDSTVLSCSVAHRYPAHGASILGVQPLESSTEDDAAFLTYSAEGTILFWNSRGSCVQNLTVAVEQISLPDDDTTNELKVARAFNNGDYLVSGDKLGVMKIYDVSSGQLLYETRAHSAEITDFAVFQHVHSTLIASSGRDRMAQVFQLPGGKPEDCELTQTLDEHVGAVTGVLFSKDAEKLVSSSSDRTIVVRESISGDLDGRKTTAFVIVRTITLKATPLSMCLSPLNDDELLVSTIDRQISRYDVATGSQNTTFKATDGDGNDSVIVGSAVYMPLGQKSGCVASVSGTDKSIRVYDEAGKLLGREYGHTEAMTGLAAIATPGSEGNKKSLVTVASDGTIFIWSVTSPADQMQEMFDRMDVARVTPGASAVFANRPPLRRVLSSQELMHLQGAREATDGISPLSGRSRSRSPRRRLSRPSLQSLKAKLEPQLEPVTEKQALVPLVRRTLRRASTADSAPAEGVLEKPPPLPLPPARRTLNRSSTATDASDTMNRAPRGRPISPTGKVQTMPRLRESKSTTQPLRRKSAGQVSPTSNLNELAVATEQMCRALHSYRKKLGGSTEVLPLEGVKELERELSMTARSLADKAARSETVIHKLLDTYSERLMGLLDDKMRQSAENGRVESPESTAA